MKKRKRIKTILWISILTLSLLIYFPIKGFCISVTWGYHIQDGSLPLDTSYPIETIFQGSGRTVYIDYGSTDYIVVIDRAWSSNNPDLGVALKAPMEFMVIL